MRFARVGRVHERHEHRAELLEVDGLGDVAIEARLDALMVDVTEDVGRESDDGLVLFLIAFLPTSDLLARLVAVLIWHVKVALRGKRVSISSFVTEQ